MCAHVRLSLIQRKVFKNLCEYRPRSALLYLDAILLSRIRVLCIQQFHILRKILRIKAILRNILRIGMILRIRIFVNRKILILRIFLRKMTILRKILRIRLILRIRIFVNTGPGVDDSSSQQTKWLGSTFTGDSTESAVHLQDEW